MVIFSQKCLFSKVPIWPLFVFWKLSRWDIHLVKIELLWTVSGAFETVTVRSPCANTLSAYVLYFFSLEYFKQLNSLKCNVSKSFIQFIHFCAYLQAILSHHHFVWPCLASEEKIDHHSRLFKHNCSWVPQLLIEPAGFLACKCFPTNLLVGHKMSAMSCNNCTMIL